MAEIFDPIQTTSTTKFSTILKDQLLSHGIRAATLSSPREISGQRPLFVLCQNYSRIAADIKHATEGITGIPNHLVAVVIIHAKAEHALPRQKTSELVDDPYCTKFGLLVDIGCLNGQLHKCDMNLRGQQAIRDFVRQHTAVSKSDSSKKAKVQPGGAQGTPVDTVGKGSRDVQYPIQLYAAPGSEIDQMLSVPEGIQKVVSLADLSEENLWIVVCHANSEESRCVSTEEIHNYRILALIDKTVNELEGNIGKSYMLVVKFNPEQTSIIATLKGVVEKHIEIHIDENVTEMFVKGTERAELYTEFGDGWTQIEGMCDMLPKTPRPVSSIVNFTKRDPRVLWLVVCGADQRSFMERALETSTSPNAKVLIVFEDNCTEVDVKFKEQSHLMIVRISPSNIPLNAEVVKKRMADFVKGIQIKMLLNPISELGMREEPGYQMVPQVPDANSKPPSKMSSCTIL